MSSFRVCPPRPRASRGLPAYPRTLLMAGLALNVAGCMGAAPDAYQPAAPTSDVLVQQPASSSGAYAQPPPDDSVPPPVPDDPDHPDDPDDYQLAGEAPAPFDP